MSSDKVKVVDSYGCLKIFTGISSPYFTRDRGGTVDANRMPPSSSQLDHLNHTSIGPFTDLIICVTGLSKEARAQVMEATQRLGGNYSSTLHPQCTHLVVQSFGGRKFQYALKHGSKNGLSIVTLGWFVDSARRNVRMSESAYSVKWEEGNDLPLGESTYHHVAFTRRENSCLPVMALHDARLSLEAGITNFLPTGEECRRNTSLLSNTCIYIDENISFDLKKKIVEVASKEGAKFVDHWYIGSNTSHIVCEGVSVKRYLGHAANLVTPSWMLKSIKEKHLQRLVHLSSDLARQVVMLVEHAQNSFSRQENEDCIVSPSQQCGSLASGQLMDALSERRKIVELAKQDIRNWRCYPMRAPLQPITPCNLMESICWSVSEPTICARVYDESSSEMEDRNDTSVFVDANEEESEASFQRSSRLLRESEKMEVVFKNHFLTILFPVDRHSEMGPMSRTFFSNSGFTCIQVLDQIYNFYQEDMTAVEIELAIHTDSRHGDTLRRLYASKECLIQGRINFRRVDFIGSRKSFEALKRVNCENNGNVYELLTRA